MINQRPPRSSEDARRHADKLLALSAVVLILVGTIVYGVLEDWSWVDSLYFSVVAVTTVGFGDLTPSTDGSKLFTVLYVLSGISIISLWLNERLRRQPHPPLRAPTEATRADLARRPRRPTRSRGSLGRRRGPTPPDGP